MNKFQLLIRKFWIKVEKPIWSFIINCCFWLVHLNKIGEARKEMEAIKSLKLETLMGMFKWTADTFKDWVQWPSTLIYNDFKGDCDDAARLAYWWFKQNGVEAEILNLYSAKEGHAVCITKDRKKMVTNELALELNPETWEQDMMSFFHNKYDTVI